MSPKLGLKVWSISALLKEVHKRQRAFSECCGSREAETLDSTRTEHLLELLNLDGVQLEEMVLVLHLRHRVKVD